MSTLQTANIQTLSTATLPVIKDSAGTEYGKFCRAFVNFNGTTSPGTIRGSFNVSSVTKNGTGNYTVNFTNALSDSNYTTVAASRQDVDTNENAYDVRIAKGGLYSTTQVQVVHGYYTTVNSYNDLSYGCVAVFG